jgi:NAD(P)H-dependent flavin oxidoreductase YrpB (nitropropane dioxygenase family)
LKEHGIAWFACATTLAEAREAECAGADAIVAQGYGSRPRGTLHFVRERAAEEPTACLALFKELVELWIVHPPEPVLQRVVAWCYSFGRLPSCR